MSIFGAVAFVVGVSLLIDLWMGPKATLTGKIILSIIPLAAMLMGVYFVLGARKAKVILHADAIESVGLLSTRRLRFQDIGAKARIQGTLTNYLLYPKRTSQKKIRLEMAYGFDAVFLDWLKTIPDADPHFFESRPS
jgi:hypothetical protein